MGCLTLETVTFLRRPCDWSIYVRNALPVLCVYVRVCQRRLGVLAYQADGCAALVLNRTTAATGRGYSCVCVHLLVLYLASATEGLEDAQQRRKPTRPASASDLPAPQIRASQPQTAAQTAARRI